MLAATILGSSMAFIDGTVVNVALPIIQKTLGASVRGAQWVVEAFKRFQISDELCDKFGYQKLTKDDKAKIFGLNAAKIYGVNVNAQRNAFPADTLSKLKQTYLSQGGQRSNAAYGWVRVDA